MGRYALRDPEAVKAHPASGCRKPQWLQVLLCLYIALANHGTAYSAQKSDYPSRPVRVIVPFPPSGGTDIVARLLVQQLAERFGQPFVIDNRPGAASTIGAQIAARAAPDGYTLLLVTASYAISASFYKSLPYDSIADFDAVAHLAWGPLLVAVHPSVAASSIKELVAIAKAAPDKLNYASGGAGGINHLAAEMLKTMTGIRMVHVPYKGAGPALTALVGGEAQVMIATAGSALAQVRTGKLRALATCGDRRSSILPDLPIVAESGVPGYAADNWYGLVSPRSVPRAIVSELNKQIAAILSTALIRERYIASGFEPSSSSAMQFATYIHAEIRKWKRVMSEAGIRPE
jgi:tripartite-type tricarboxylate transporter receptor subunit TctC